MGMALLLVAFCYEGRYNLWPGRANWLAGHYTLLFYQGDDGNRGQPGKTGAIGVRGLGGEPGEKGEIGFAGNTVRIILVTINIDNLLFAWRGENGKRVTSSD